MHTDPQCPSEKAREGHGSLGMAQHDRRKVWSRENSGQQGPDRRGLMGHTKDAPPSCALRGQGM